MGPQLNDPKVKALLDILPDCRGMSQLPQRSLPHSVEYGLLTIDVVCVALINKLLAMDSHMMLVLSSTHRNYLTYFDGFRSDAHLNRLRAYLTALGLDVPVMFDITPKLYVERGAEVAEFIMQNESLNINEYVIIDDSTDFYSEQPLVKVDPIHGFLFDDFASCIRLLSLPAPSQMII